MDGLASASPRSCQTSWRPWNGPSKPLQLNPLSTRHLQSPSRSHHPTHATTDHYLSDTPLGLPEDFTGSRVDGDRYPGQWRWRRTAHDLATPRRIELGPVTRTDEQTRVLVVADEAP